VGRAGTPLRGRIVRTGPLCRAVRPHPKVPGASAGGSERRWTLRGVTGLCRSVGLPDGTGLARRKTLCRRSPRPGDLRGYGRRRSRRSATGFVDWVRPPRQWQFTRIDLRSGRLALPDHGGTGRLPAAAGGWFGAGGRERGLVALQAGRLGRRGAVSRVREFG